MKILLTLMNRNWEGAQALGDHNPVGTGAGKGLPPVEEIKPHMGQVGRDPGD